MAMGFNPLLAIGSGLAKGIESGEAYKREKQDKIDDEYRKRAIDLSYETDLYTAKKKLDSQQVQQDMSTYNNIAGLNKRNTTNQSSYDALKQAQQTPAISQDTSVTGEDTPSPTNTPQTTVSSTAPVQNNVQQGTPSTPAQGGLNSPQGGEVPLQIPQQTPQQGDNTNPLIPPKAQQGDAPDLSGGQPTIPTGDDEITDSFGNKLTREQASRAVAFGLQENVKMKGALTPEAAYQLGISKVMKQDGELGSKIHNEGLNTFGFKIGTIPDGFSVPVLPEKFDITKRMTPAQASIKLRKDDEGLAKDRDAAVQANKAATEFSMYLSGNEAGDTGGLNKIGFIRDFTGALSTKDATLDSVNKSLTFNIVGFERTPGMRLTQAEFFIAREAMPGRGNTAEANKNIAQFWQAKLQLPQEYAAFKTDYIGINGSWNEAIGERMFQEYQQKNPIFDPAVLDNPEKAQLADFKLNPNRQSIEQFAKSGGFDSLMKTFGVQQPIGHGIIRDTSGEQPQQTAPKILGTWNPKTGKIE